MICSQSYVSVHQFAGDDDWLSAACLAFRSNLSAYYLSLTSRLAFDRGEALSGHILDVPIPHPSALPTLDSVKPNDFDKVIENAFQLKEPERALISDLLEFGYREGASKSGDKPSRKLTVRSSEDDRDDVFRYADFFIKARSRDVWQGSSRSGNDLGGGDRSDSPAGEGGCYSSRLARAASITDKGADSLGLAAFGTDPLVRTAAYGPHARWPADFVRARVPTSRAHLHNPQVRGRSQSTDCHLPETRSASLLDPFARTARRG